MKKTFITIARILVLTVLYFICFVGVSGALISTTAESATSEQTNAAVALFVVSTINAILIAYVILRSHWSGWKLVLGVFVLLFGITTLMPQIETAFFITHLPPGILPRLFLAGAIVAAVF